MGNKIRKLQSGGHEIDGIVYDRLQDAEAHLKDLNAGSIGMFPEWVDEQAGYAHREEGAKSLALSFMRFWNESL